MSVRLRGSKPARASLLGEDSLVAIATRYDWNKQVKSSSLLPSALFLESSRWRSLS
ncbi:MAG: hypothetical protein V7K47_20155 [Nostoc sp.]